MLRYSILPYYANFAVYNNFDVTDKEHGLILKNKL